MNDELKQIKSAVGDLPKAQKQDKAQQACADMCADGSLVNMRRKIAQQTGKSEEEVADGMNNLIMFQNKTVTRMMGAHKELMAGCCIELMSNNIPKETAGKLTRIIDMSVVYNLLLSVEKQEAKMKIAPIAGRMLEVMRSGKGFTTLDLNNSMRAKKTG